MDGYSVHDAAAVLGIAEARVWELIARGVFAGSPEADGGMRVFLKATATEPARQEAPRPNGNDNGHDVELSPFRELLSEFRNLTERYGQALLALGESRGEVAALRGRVDLLEARIDLRLPSARPVSTVAWEVPEPPGVQPATDESSDTSEASASESAVEPLPESAPAPPVDKPNVPDTARGRRHARADAAGIAEALARALDPALPELPGAQEAADALASLQRDSAEPEPAAPAEPELVDALPQPEVAAAMPADELTVELPESHVVPPRRPTDELTVELPEAPVAEAPSASIASPYSTELVEPDWFADGDFSWLEQANAASDREANGRGALGDACRA